MLPRRRIISALIVALLMAAACSGEEQPAESADTGGGGTAGDESTGGAAADVSGDLFAFGFGYETGDIIAQTRIDRFRELHPDVAVDFSESGFDPQTFLSALASGEPPDVVNLVRNDIGTYIARGVLAPLDDCIAQEEIDMGVFYEAGVNQVTVDGTPYALPEFANSRVWILNNAAFEEAGMDPEELDLSDWDAIAEANEQLTQTEGGRLTRIGLDPKLPEFLPLWSWANGAPMISEDGLTANLGDPGVAEALTASAAMHEPAGGRVTFLDFRDTWDFFGAANQYASDQLAGMPMEQWYLNVLAEVSPDTEITVRPFQTRDGEPITWSDGNSWAITAASDNPEAACAFIATMTETESWVAAGEARAEERAADGLPHTGVYSGNQEADEIIFGEQVDLSEYPSLQEAVQVVLDVQEHAFALPPSPAAQEFANAWTTAATAVINGEGEAEAELQAAQETVQAAIDAAAP
jgi:multiple sugar transport system substrate-binding protein